MKKRIELTEMQTKRILAIRAQMEPLRLQLTLLEQCVHGMLVTVLEERGVENGVSATLTDDARALEIPAQVEEG